MHRVKGSENLSVKGGCLVALDAGMIAGVAHIWCRDAVGGIPEGAERWETQPEEGWFRLMIDDCLLVAYSGYILKSYAFKFCHLGIRRVFSRHRDHSPFHA